MIFKGLSSELISHKTDYMDDMSQDQSQLQPVNITVPESLDSAVAIQQIVEATSAANRTAGDLVERKKFRAAKIALCRAITLDPHNYLLWCNLSSIMWNLRAFEDALACAKTSLSLNPDAIHKSCAQALLSMGNALVSLGQYDTALKAFDEADRLDPLIPDSKWNRSLLLLLLGDYTSGFKDYDLRIDLRKEEGDKDADKYKSPLWAGESLKGKTLLVLHDQGYGDTILYSRFLMESKVQEAKQIHFSTVPQLASLMWEFQLQVPILNYAPLSFVFPGTPLPETDYHVYLGSLPKLCSLSQESIPPDPGFIQSRASKEILGNGEYKIDINEPNVSPALKVGICWSGRQDFARNDERSIPLKLFLSLAENPHIWLYSLQQPQNVSQEIYDLGAEQFIQDLSPQALEKGWLGTATAILQLDLVVTCCTSVAHLAGVLGVPCWVLLHTEPYWIWGIEGSSSPWYPSVRLFRQRSDRRGDWTCVLEEVRSELVKLIQTKIRKAGV